MLSFLSEAYNYELPPGRIASYPCRPRDSARLLCLKGNRIEHRYFYELPKVLPRGASLFLNKSAVLPVRLRAKKCGGGGRAEVFLTEGAKGEHLSEQLEKGPPLCFRALLRPAHRIPIGSHLKVLREGEELSIHRSSAQEVELSWRPQDICLSEALERFGETPLPPYLNRLSRLADQKLYQCVYGEDAGSVAAPTAGLHFTRSLVSALEEQSFELKYLSLHVGMGTFLPLRSRDLRDHLMHREQFSVDLSTIKALSSCTYSIAVGTTSLRSLESIYWYGCLLAQAPSSALDIPPFVYKEVAPLPVAEAMDRVIDQFKKDDTKRLSGYTSLYITPGYCCRVVRGLITNFHQPRSTLLVLLASLIGEQWRKVYQEALAREYRFLSYGDACFFALEPPSD